MLNPTPPQVTFITRNDYLVRQSAYLPHKIEVNVWSSIELMRLRFSSNNFDYNVLLQKMSINLDNFEVDDFARDTPFVLTSPTSLQACSELDIEVIYSYLFRPSPTQLSRKFSHFLINSRRKQRIMLITAVM